MKRKPVRHRGDEHEPEAEDELSAAGEDVGDLLSGATPDLETAKNIERPQLHSRRPARTLRLASKQEELEAFFTRLPAAGESLHIVSNGSFDYWCFVPVSLRLLGRAAEEFYGSTWTMNRDNVGELLTLFDKGKIKRAAVLTGTYFKRRESAVANTLIEGLRARGQRYVAFQNHAKVMLLAAPPDYLVMEGSANFTANPRLEQTVYSNDRALFDFHREWMESMLKSGEKEGPEA